MPNVRTIAINELDKLGVDDDNRLYWDGKPIVVEERLRLQWWVNASAVLGASSGFVLAVIEVLRYLSGK